MAEGTPKAIEMKGIVRNATKIGVQDGQSDDLVNLRFMDGSWRASGDGRLIDFTMNRTYTQLYVHTNIYHHLLGVYEGTLYWFAEIGNDGVSFYALQPDKTGYPEDMQDLPSAPVALTTVVGDVWITQTGHLLTIIDEADQFEYYLFSISQNTYKRQESYDFDSATSRSLFPFGQIHFNLTREGVPVKQKTLAGYNGRNDFYGMFDAEWDINFQKLNGYFNAALIHNTMIEMYAEQRTNNKFTRPFLAVAAIKDYSGKYHYASMPVLLHIGEQMWRMEKVHGRKFKEADDGGTMRPIYGNAVNVYYVDDENNNILAEEDSAQSVSKWPEEEGNLGTDYFHMPYASIHLYSKEPPVLPTDIEFHYWDLFVGGAGEPTASHTSASMYRGIVPPVFSAGIYLDHSIDVSIAHDEKLVSPHLQISAADMTLSIDQHLIDFLRNNKDTFTSLAIFITPEVDVYNMEADSGEHKEGYVQARFIAKDKCFAFYKPYVRRPQDVIYDLMHSPFFLLREYNWKELNELTTNPVVDLSGPQYLEILNNITQQPRLDVESTNRTTYLPKVTYYYNNKLHIANYKSFAYRGYPIDMMHLHNHSLKVEKNSWYADVLRNLTNDNDEYLQYPREKVTFDDSILPLAGTGAPFFISKTYIETVNGERFVLRYIPIYNPTTHNSHDDGCANYIEDLSPLLCFPDARATRIELYYIESYRATAGIIPGTISGTFQQVAAGVYAKYKSFDLTPHQYLDIAYHIDPDMKPIKLSSFNTWNPHATQIDNQQPLNPVGGGTQGV